MKYAPTLLKIKKLALKIFYLEQNKYVDYFYL